jgi:hypothetical protein
VFVIRKLPAGVSQIAAKTAFVHVGGAAASDQFIVNASEFRPIVFRNGVVTFDRVIRRMRCDDFIVIFASVCSGFGVMVREHGEMRGV